MSLFQFDKHSQWLCSSMLHRTLLHNYIAHSKPKYLLSNWKGDYKVCSCFREETNSSLASMAKQLDTTCNA